MKPHADVLTTMRALLAQAALQPAPPVAEWTPPPTPPTPVLSPSACLPQPAQTRKRTPKKPKGLTACDVCGASISEKTLTVSPVDTSLARCVDCCQPTVRHSNFIDATIVTPADLRDPSNNRPHIEVPYTGPAPRTAAQAAKLRKKAAQACGCRLCALALNPPTTFADWQRLVGPGLDAEQERIIFGGPRIKSTYLDKRSRDERRQYEETNAWEKATYGEKGITR